MASSSFSRISLQEREQALWLSLNEQFCHSESAVLAFIKEECEKHPNINLNTPQCKSALIIQAVLYRRLLILKHLLSLPEADMNFSPNKRRIDVNIFSRSNLQPITALHLAIMKNDPEIVAMLLQCSRVDVNKCCGLCRVHCNLSFDDIEKLSLSCPDCEGVFSPLQLAVRISNGVQSREVVQLLVNCPTQRCYNLRCSARSPFTTPVYIAVKALGPWENPVPREKGRAFLKFMEVLLSHPAIAIPSALLLSGKPWRDCGLVIRDRNLMMQLKRMVALYQLQRCVRHDLLPLEIWRDVVEFFV